MPKVLLGSGRLVTLIPEYGPDATLKAAEMADCPSRMSLLDSMYYNIATVAVAVKVVQEELAPEVTDDATKEITAEATYGKAQTQQDIFGDATSSHEMLKAFRKFFTEEDWDQLAEAVSEAYAVPKSGKMFKLIR
jgi:hypothetical protein